MELAPDDRRRADARRSTEDPALGLRQREKIEILFAVMLGLFLGALDQTIVGPALPTIVTHLSGNDVLRLGRHDLPAHEHDQRARSGASSQTSTGASRSS